MTSRIAMDVLPFGMLPTNDHKNAERRQCHVAIRDLLRHSAIATLLPRAKIIELNDQLRTTFVGGRVLAPSGNYNLDPRIRGHALCVMTRYRRFDAASEHDWGRFIFRDYAFE